MGQRLPIHKPARQITQYFNCTEFNTLPLKLEITSAASLMGQSVNNLPAMQKTQVQFLGRKDPLEKEMAVHSSILAWRIPGTEEPGTVHGVTRVRHDLATKPPSPWL